MFTARKYVRIGTKMYKPGDEIPQEAMDNEQWKHLYAKKAITGSPDPVEAILDDGEDAQTPVEPETVPEETGPVEEQGATEPDAEPAKKKPEKPKNQKPGKGKAGTEIEAEPELPNIDMDGLVVDKKEE